MESAKENQKKGNLEGVPVDSSPYTQSKSLEEYKEQGYGAPGHREPQAGRGASASTDAPTMAGAAATDLKAQLGTDPANRQ